MRTIHFFSLLLVIVMVIGFALFGCNKSPSPSSPPSSSELPFEALYLGNNLFVITKTSEETSVNLHLPLVAHFDSQQEIQVGDAVALAFDEIMESFPAQAKITASEKLPQETKAYTASFNLAYQLLQIRPDKTHLIDVRTIDEFESGHVPDSINIPVDQINDIVDSIPDLDSTLLIYCRSGRRTVTAARALIDLGYKVIFDLGGISNYEGDLEKGR